MSYSNFLLKLSLFTVGVLGALGIMASFASFKLNYSFILMVVGLIALLTAALFVACRRSQFIDEGAQVGNVFTLATGVKMGVTLVFYLVYQHFVATLSKIDILFFFGIYAAFIALELMVLVKMISEKD